MIDGPALTDIIANGNLKVPPAPATALRLKSLVQDPACTVDDLTAAVSVDPSVAAAVLRQANGGAFKDLLPVASVAEAVARLDRDELPRIALAIATGGAAASEGPLVQLRRLVWRRSLCNGLICRFVAALRGKRSGDAFACGLLHDFGWIVALSALEDLLAQHPEEGERSADSWLALVDQFHILLGHIAATRWDLPPMIAEAILCHHDTGQASPAYRPVIELVAAADRIVELLESAASVSAEDVARVSGLGRDVADKLTEALPKIAGATMQLLDLTPAPAPRSPEPSKVARAANVLHGRLKTVRWHGTWAGRGKPVAGVITTMAADGLVVLLPVAPKENYIIKLTFAAGTTPMEVFVSPAVIDATATGQFNVQARLFALAGESKRIWERLYASLPA
ncbi:MAG TPA: HDOD domain-containing protein [Polyangia bacterium]